VESPCVTGQEAWPVTFDLGPDWGGVGHSGCDRSPDRTFLERFGVSLASGFSSSYLRSHPLLCRGRACPGHPGHQTPQTKPLRSSHHCRDSHVETWVWPTWLDSCSLWDSASMGQDVISCVNYNHLSFNEPIRSPIRRYPVRKYNPFKKDGKPPCY